MDDYTRPTEIELDMWDLEDDRLEMRRLFTITGFKEKLLKEELTDIDYLFLDCLKRKLTFEFKALKNPPYMTVREVSRWVAFFFDYDGEKTTYLLKPMVAVSHQTLLKEIVNGTHTPSVNLWRFLLEPIGTVIYRENYIELILNSKNTL